MKWIMMNFGLVFFVILLYFSGVFKFFTYSSVLWTAVGVIVLLFIAAIWLVGLPKRKD